MAVIARTYDFVDGTVIYSAQVDSDFNTIYSEFNGSIDNDNIKAAAGIVGSKLNLAVPGAIGSTTPAAGAFTTLSATGTTTITGVATLTSPLFTGTIDGWIAAGETWTYAAADAPTYTITVPTDATTKYSAGMRIKLTHGGSVKYFIITKVAATVLTLYGGTDYTLADTAITLPYYSTMKAPQGFPLDPIKWTVKITDTTARSQTTPTQNTWYNLGSVNIGIPIGVWNVPYIVSLKNSLAAKYTASTLSTANNSETDSEFTFVVMAAANDDRAIANMSKYLNLATKTTYYINTRTPSASSGTIYNDNDSVVLIIRAICAYL